MITLSCVFSPLWVVWYDVWRIFRHMSCSVYFTKSWRRKQDWLHRKKEHNATELIISTRWSLNHSPQNKTRIIVNKTLHFLRANEVINEHQYCFLSGCSTISNLLECISYWTVSTNDKKSVGVTYIDYKRAFDSVSISKLVLKLRPYGISGQLLSRIECFLHKRTHQTRVGTSLSTITSLTSGVVQESVIGPLLFILYINEIVSLFDDKSCL